MQFKKKYLNYKERSHLRIYQRRSLADYSKNGKYTKYMHHQVNKHLIKCTAQASFLILELSGRSENILAICSLPVSPRHYSKRTQTGKESKIIHKWNNALWDHSLRERGILHDITRIRIIAAHNKQLIITYISHKLFIKL